MGNFNISIDLTKLPGARVMDIEGKTMTKRCVVIPIDNHVGTVCDGYTVKLPDGGLTTKFFDEVKLNIVAIEHRTKKFGVSHGIKPSFSKEMMERMTEEQMYNSPWLGVLKPWGVIEEKKDDIGDLPEGDDNGKNW